jgi:hypothetical protein
VERFHAAKHATADGAAVARQGRGPSLPCRRGQRLVVELQGSLAKIKTLSGLLPICASCKKIRDDQGYWSQVENYIAEHTTARFSHGLCPACLRKFFPE